MRDIRLVWLNQRQLRRVASLVGVTTRELTKGCTGRYAGNLLGDARATMDPAYRRRLIQSIKEVVE